MDNVLTQSEDRRDLGYGLPISIFNWHHRFPLSLHDTYNLPLNCSCTDPKSHTTQYVKPSARGGAAYFHWIGKNRTKQSDQFFLRISVPNWTYRIQLYFTIVQNRMSPVWPNHDLRYVVNMAISFNWIAFLYVPVVWCPFHTISLIEEERVDGEGRSGGEKGGLGENALFSK